MKIGIVGTRGIPNAYGGFEQFAEYLSVGLVDKGHEVIVYCLKDQSKNQQKTFRGVQLIYFQDYEKSLGTAGQFLYDLKCILNTRKQNFDIILNLGYTSSAIWYHLFPKKSKLLTNMDGLEWKRSKFSPLVQKFLKFSEKHAVKKSHYLIADSMAIKHYLHQTFNRDSKFIAYGAHLFSSPEEEIVLKFGLFPNSYSLLIARMEPENNIEMILSAYSKSNKIQPLIVIGNINNEHGQTLINKYADYPNIIFKNAIYDISLLNNLRFYSSLYFHGHSVGGTNPSLLEAMACKSLIVAHYNEFNKSVLGENAFYFSSAEELTLLIQHQNLHDEKRERFTVANYNKIKNEYSWDYIINKYEEYFKTILQWKN